MRIYGRLAILAVVLLGAGAPARADLRIESAIGGSADWAMKYYEREGPDVGPTVLVVGGVHGNEPAGEYAAEQIRRWPIARGRLVVIPQANKHARKAFKRFTPDVDEELRDLNRNFPRAGEKEKPRGKRARAIWNFVRILRPRWIVDLHEGKGFRQTNAKTVGSSVIYHPTPQAEAAARLMIDAVNETIDSESRMWVPLRGLVDGSLARAAGEHLRTQALIVESTWSKQPRSLRARQHRIAVYALLRHLNMVDPAAVHADTVRDPEHSEGLAVALYDAHGSAGRGVPYLWRQFRAAKGIDPMRIGPDEIRDGALRQHDVIVFPGGTGSGQGTALTDAGRNRLKEYIHRGGGYVGICAGAYLALNGFEWGLGVLGGKTVSPKWKRGAKTLKVRLTDEGRKLFGDREEILALRYHNGPVFKPGGSGSGRMRTLAVFEEEIANFGAPKDVMVGTPAIASSAFGKGRVLVFSPHPEQTKGLEHLVLSAVHWVGDTGVPRQRGMSGGEWKQLRSEARSLMAKYGNAKAKRSLLTRLVRDSTNRSWGLIAECARKEARHCATLAKLRIANWKETAAVWQTPLPHESDVRREIVKLLDSSQGTTLRAEERLLRAFVEAMENAPPSAREKFVSVARAGNPYLRSAGERAAVLGALAGGVAPTFRNDHDSRVRMAQVDAARAGGADMVSFLRAALQDKNWAVRVLAARVAAEHQVGDVVVDLVGAFPGARQREAHELGRALRKLTGKNFESTASVWTRWWRDEAAQQAEIEERESDGPASTPQDPKRVIFYGLPIESDRVCFLIDTSGSMATRATPANVTGGPERRGSRLDVAKKELRRAVKSLPSDTMFNIVAFSTAVMPWKTKPVPATPENKENAAAWIDSWKADGNTCMYGGLRSAFRMAGLDPLENGEPVLDTIVILSDGMPTGYSSGNNLGTTELRRWVRWYNAYSLMRIHAVSITSGKASALLKAMAAEHDGYFAER